MSLAIVRLYNESVEQIIINFALEFFRGSCADAGDDIARAGSDIRLRVTQSMNKVRSRNQRREQLAHTGLGTPLPKEEPIRNISVHLSAGAALPWRFLKGLQCRSKHERPGLLGTKGEI
jgi:hypothetical protein